MRTFSALTIILGLIVVAAEIMGKAGDSAIAGWIFTIGVVVLVGWLFGRKQASQHPPPPEEVAPIAKESQSKTTAPQAYTASNRPADEPRYGSVKNK